MYSFLASQSPISSLSDQNPLIQAIFQGDADEVRSLIHRKEDVNALDEERRAPLHSAAYLGDVEIINLLILSGARIDAKDSKWLTPLHRACASRSEEAVCALLKHQADVNARDKLWQSPLHVAAANDAVACIELLIPHLSNLNSSDRAGRQAIHHATWNGHLNVVNLLLKHGANIHVYDRQERKALHWAAFKGHTEIIKTLVANGAELNCKEKKFGDTPVHAAAAVGQIAAVRILLDLGFDINTQNYSGATPLHRACTNGQDVIVHELLQANADPNIVNKAGCTPLHNAAASKQGALCLELLVNNGADVNVCSNEGKTPLHMTAVHGRFTRSQTLLQTGANAEAVDNQGNSALHVAATHGHELLVSTLLEAGVDPNIHGSEGRLPIHLAALNGHVNCCRKLLNSSIYEESGMSAAEIIGQTDEEGRSCLHHAACGGSLECLEVFLTFVDSIEVLSQRDSKGRTPLHYSLSSASKECSRRLISAMKRESFSKDLNDADNDGKTLLHHAAAADINGGCVELLLERDVDVLKKDNDGYSALHYAAACGHETVVKLITEADNNVLNATHANEASVPSPLHLASYHGHSNVVLYLSEYLLYLDIPDPEGRSPLELAAFQGNSECIRALQMQGASVTLKNTKNKQTALHMASCNGHARCMQLLVDGATLDQGNLEGNGIARFINSRDSDKCTPLMHCVTNGHLTAVDFLLAKNALVWPVDKFGCTAIHRGAVVGHEDIVRNLLSQYQQQNRPVRARFINDGESTVTSGSIIPAIPSQISPVITRSHSGRTSLHFASIQGNASMLESLLQVATEVNVIDRFGYTPLHYACFFGQEPCADAILLHSSFVKFEGSSFSPLHCAVYNNNEACADRLLETLGDDIVILKDKLGKSPLHAAVQNNHIDCVHFLLSHGADVDTTDNQGQSPLMLASQLGHDNSLELLLKAKADYALVDTDNNNALHLSCIHGNEFTAEFLLRVIDDPSVINAQNNNGQTPVHIAARKGLTIAVLSLLERNCDLDVMDNEVLTPALSCAPDNNVGDCLDLIISQMLKNVRTNLRHSEGFSYQAVRESLGAKSPGDGSLGKKMKRFSLMEPHPVHAPEKVANTDDDSDSETY